VTVSLGEKGRRIQTLHSLKTSQKKPGPYRFHLHFQKYSRIWSQNYKEILVFYQKRLNLQQLLSIIDTKRAKKQ
jgi:hypothetical protein